MEEKRRQKKKVQPAIIEVSFLFVARLRNDLNGRFLFCRW
jgi:hypothetical protein